MILELIQLEKKDFFNKASKLRDRSLPVTDFGVDFQQEVDNLLETFMSWKIAVGLSAPQVGIKKRLAVISLDKNNEPLIIVNPVIISDSGKKDTKKESCMSLPNVRGDVVRRYKLSVKFQDRFGEEKSIDAEGFLARVILHEIDHLDGILFVDRMDNNKQLEDFNIQWE